MPILVLTLLCLFMTGALALVNSITYPVIKAGAADRAFTAMKEIIPFANEFTKLEINREKFPDIPETVSEIYTTDNDSGYIFIIYIRGYGGTMKLICGINPDGKIIKSKVLAHSETPGFAATVFDRAVKYEGEGKAFVSKLDAITGATITSNAYKNALLDAFSAFEAVKGGGS